MVIFNDAISGKYGILSSYLSVLSANAVFLTGKDYFANVNVDDLLNFLKYGFWILTSYIRFWADCSDIPFVCNDLL